MPLYLTILTALTTASRTIDMHHSNTEHMGTRAYCKLHKRWRKGQVPSTLKLYTYSEDPRLCAVQCIDEYLEQGIGAVGINLNY